MPFDTHRLERREILRILYEAWPQPIARDRIYLYLNTLGYALVEEDLAAPLEYLFKAGYIECQTMHTDVRKVIRCTLTKAGVDLWENPDLSDPGIASPIRS